MPNPFWILDWARIVWCDVFHGGGNIQRDDQGRINWRCAKCGRWSDSPVPRDEERRSTDAALAEFAAKSNRKQQEFAMFNLKQVQSEIDRLEAENRDIEKRTGGAWSSVYAGLVAKHKSNRDTLKQLYLARDKDQRPVMYQP